MTIRLNSETAPERHRPRWFLAGCERERWPAVLTRRGLWRPGPAKTVVSVVRSPWEINEIDCRRLWMMDGRMRELTISSNSWMRLTGEARDADIHFISDSMTLTGKGKLVWSHGNVHIGVHGTAVHATTVTGQWWDRLSVFSGLTFKPRIHQTHVAGYKYPGDPDEQLVSGYKWIPVHVAVCRVDDNFVADTCRQRQAIQMDTTCIRATRIRCKRGITRFSYAPGVQFLEKIC